MEVRNSLLRRVKIFIELAGPDLEIQECEVPRGFNGTVAGTVSGTDNDESSVSLTDYLAYLEAKNAISNQEAKRIRVERPHCPEGIEISSQEGDLWSTHIKGSSIFIPKGGWVVERPYCPKSIRISFQAGDILGTGIKGELNNHSIFIPKGSLLGYGSLHIGADGKIDLNGFRIVGIPRGKNVVVDGDMRIGNRSIKVPTNHTINFPEGSLLASGSFLRIGTGEEINLNTSDTSVRMPLGEKAVIDGVIHVKHRSTD